MKKNIVKLASLVTVFAFGLGLALNTQKQPISVSAEQHSANYADYTYSGTYYDSLNTSGTDGLTGTFLNALYTHIFPKAWYTYSGNTSGTLGQELQKADEDPTNSANMVLLYTRDSIKKTAATVNNVMQWNREHVWPQANSSGCWGTENGGTDLLHLRPTYETTNSARGNLKYGYVSGSPSALKYNGMTYGYKEGSYFEPLDSVKGDVARIIMYVYTAYNTYYGNKLSITNTFASYDTLLKWHTADKPDAMEGHRNDYVESSNQKNRNPFVDHPEYAWRIFGDSCSAAVKQACMEAYPIEGYVPSGQGGQGQGGEGGQGGQGGQGTVPTSNLCSITFANNSTDSGDDITSGNFVDTVEENDLVESVSDITKIYHGTQGLKFGSSKQTGSITFNLLETAKHNVDSIVIKSVKYNNKSATFTLKVNGQVVEEGIEVGEETVVDLSAPTTVNSIRLEASGERAYLKELSAHIYVEEQQGQGEQGSGNTSEPSVDTSVPTPASSDPAIPEPEIEPLPPEEEKGCGGSIIATTSLFTISALAGLSFIFIKRRRY